MRPRRIVANGRRITLGPGLANRRRAGRSLVPEFLLADRSQDAACYGLDPEAWTGDQPKARRAAKAICQRCPFRDACRDWAIANRRHATGIWGATDEAQRDRLAKKT